MHSFDIEFYEKIGADQKFWCRQNIGVDKILVSTKYWHRQNIRINKILMSTKYMRQQNIGIDKIYASTKYWHRQNICVNKILAPTKYRGCAAEAIFCSSCSAHFISVEGSSVRLGYSRNISHSVLPCFRQGSSRVYYSPDHPQLVEQATVSYVRNSSS